MKYGINELAQPAPYSRREDGHRGSAPRWAAEGCAHVYKILHRA